jgi:predicted PhzF superfamily epimerase YddE/YHI9
MGMSLNMYQVDVFTDRAFAGNPAAVCLLPAPRGEKWMQDVAREMNLSDTAFVVPREEGAFGLRWFTPTAEVELCGHATLASAHVLWQTGILAPGEEARFHTLSGWLTAGQVDGGIELDFPANPVSEMEPPPGLVEALGVEPRFVGKSIFDYLVEVESETAVRSLAPDLGRLAAFPVRGVIVTARSASPVYDFVSRFFAPAYGIPEDPATGSAHCALGPYWGALLGKDDLLAFQASPRSGRLRVRLAGERVKLIGQAVTVMEGQLLDS